VDWLRDALPGVLGTALGLLLSSAVLFVLLAGFCTLLGLPKLRASGGRSRVVRSLDEALGRPQAYLPPDAPVGAPISSAPRNFSKHGNVTARRFAAISAA
jgi:hypothetical protein